MFCMNCGHEIEENATSCSRCGTPVSAHSGNAMQNTKVENYRNKTVASLGKHYHIIIGIIAIILGSFGVHKFLMGRKFIWILYFIFSWTFIPLIIGIIEGIIYLTCTEEKFEKKYLYRAKENEKGE